MHENKPRVLIFIVAYNAARTLDKVIRRIPLSLVDTYDVEVLIIDDGSKDETFHAGMRTSAAQEWPFRITVLHNPVNQGYGGNQKIGYHYAIENGYDFVALLHGDGQYAPEFLPTLLEPLKNGEAEAVFGSRMQNPKDALKGGMPLYKFAGNRILTSLQNFLLGAKLTEFHSGYRIYSVEALKRIPFDRNTNVFHFDTEIIIQLLTARQRIKELAIPTYYGDEICHVNGVQYAGKVVRASLQAALQQVHLFYDRRFDCAPVEDGRRYPSKLDFDSTHSRVLEIVPAASHVLDLGSGMGAVGAALKERKGCHVVGVDMERGAFVDRYDEFIAADLNGGIPDVGTRQFDYILALDVIEHLSNPEEFLDQLRHLAARSPGAQVIVTTANIGFILVRLSLLLGRFEYGKRGILDLTHTRLFTFATLRRAMDSAGFTIARMEGVPVPAPFVFGSSRLGRALLVVNRTLTRLRPTLFGFQSLFVATPRPTLETLLADAKSAAAEMNRDGLTARKAAA
jgi:glycosyltransferase involved in cell wall biosynthesis/2-polyprenyl-3-methyl-5-hydroxy-6-metoxy-1,4-benzoquinol methylase